MCSMIHNCPNIDCPDYQTSDSIIRDGKFFRKDDCREIQRFRCKTCRTRFSSSTFSLAKNQKKRRINRIVEHLFCSAVTMRRSARIAGVTRKTIKRKFDYFSIKAELEQEERLMERQKKKMKKVQFDDLITSEHTKMKPLSVSIMVEEKSRLIAGAEVSVIPAFGLLAEKSVDKYGYRKSTHREALERLFEKVQHSIDPEAAFKTDKHESYPEFVENYFPEATHKTYKGRKASVTGQGELKKSRFDPLFAINHACAMFRANISRLVRRTWSTTKDATMLQKHLNIYINYHNKHHLAPLLGTS